MVQHGFWLADMKLHRKLSWLIFFFLLTLHACAMGQAREEAEKQDTVCITRTGKKYHVCTCRYLSQSSISVTLKDAVARGYGACSVCDPPETADHSNHETINVTEAQPEARPAQRSSATSRQCMATTKAGLRCKRTTSNASGKCWQHE